MSTRDNAPPPEGWRAEPRECPCFIRADRLPVEDESHLVRGAE